MAVTKDFQINRLRVLSEPSFSATYSLYYKEHLTPTFNLVASGLSIDSDGYLNTPQVISGLDGNTYYIVRVVNEMCGSLYDEYLPYFVPQDIGEGEWRMFAFTCAQDNVFTFLSSITSLSSPNLLAYYLASNIVYGVDVDNPLGNVFSYPPTATLNTDLTYFPIAYASGAQPWIYAQQYDKENSMLYLAGKDTSGMRAFNILTGSYTLVPYGFNHNVPPTGGSGPHTGFNRTFLGIYDNIILANCSYAQALYTIDRTALVLSNTIPFSGIPNYDKCFIGSPQINKIGSSFWVIQSEASTSTAPNQDSAIYKYDMTFSTNTGTIALPGSLKVTPNFNNFTRYTYISPVTGYFYVLDAGSNQLFQIETSTESIINTYVFDNKTAGKKYTSCSFLRNPVTNDMFISVSYFNNGGDTSRIPATFMWDETTNTPTQIFANEQFPSLERIGATSELHSAVRGLAAWEGGAWQTDGHIDKYSV